MLDLSSAEVVWPSIPEADLVGNLFIACGIRSSESNKWEFSETGGSGNGNGLEGIGCFSSSLSNVAPVLLAIPKSDERILTAPRISPSDTFASNSRERESFFWILWEKGVNSKSLKLCLIFETRDFQVLCFIYLALEK